MFTSRYPGGSIIEIDFSQLEIVILACLSGDERLLADMETGRDLHFETGKSVFGWKTEADMDKLDRRIVKGVNFGLVYGGGWRTISNLTGADPDTVKALIKAFYDRYPGVAKWQEETMAKVKDAATWGPSRTTSGRPAKDSQLVSPLGRVWRFTEDDPPWGGDPNFSPTKVKNYPVQGFATGDIVPLAVKNVAELICRERQKSPTNTFSRVHLTCTVHDSIILDVDKDVPIGYVATYCAQAMTAKVSRDLKEVYGVTLPVDLVVEATYGPNWYEQKKIKL